MANVDYTIQMTRGEILWLGRILGKMAFPILFPKGKGLDFQKLAGEIGEGKKSLISKGWVNTPTKNRFEVDQLIYFLVDWLSQPTEVTAFQTIFPEREPVHCAVYRNENHHMLVEFKEEMLEIQLFKEAAAMRYRLADLIHGVENPGQSQEVRQFPNLQPLELIRLAWRSSDRAIEALRVANYMQPAIDDFMEWMKDVKSAGLITKYDYEKNGDTPLEQALYLIDGSGNWLSALSGGEASLITLERKPIEDIIQN